LLHLILCCWNIQYSGKCLSTRCTGCSSFDFLPHFTGAAACPGWYLTITLWMRISLNCKTPIRSSTFWCRTCALNVNVFISWWIVFLHQLFISHSFSRIYSQHLVTLVYSSHVLL
jgi:hypothetical protein